MQKAELGESQGRMKITGKAGWEGEESGRQFKYPTVMSDPSPTSWEAARASFLPT